MHVHPIPLHSNHNISVNGCVNLQERAKDFGIDSMCEKRLGLSLDFLSISFLDGTLCKVRHGRALCNLFTIHVSGSSMREMHLMIVLLTPPLRTPPPTLGMYLNKGQALSDWDALRPDQTALIKYAALDALVSYCVFRKMETAERILRSDSSVQIGSSVEVTDGSDRVIALGDVCDMDDTGAIHFSLRTNTVMAPCASVRVGQDDNNGDGQTSDLLTFSDPQQWAGLLERARLKDDSGHIAELAGHSVVSLHDVFEVVALAKSQAAIRLKCHQDRCNLAISGFSYEKALMPMPEAQLRLLLDLFHAEQRLTSAANKHHCCYKDFIGLLRDAFLRVDEDEFQRLVSQKAEEWSMSLADCEYELRHVRWRWVRQKLPCHIPAPHQLLLALNDVLAHAETFHDPKYGTLADVSLKKVRQADRGGAGVGAAFLKHTLVTHCSCLFRLLKA